MFIKYTYFALILSQLFSIQFLNASEPISTDKYSSFFRNFFQQDLKVYSQTIASVNFDESKNQKLKDAILEQANFLKSLRNKGQLIDGGLIPLFIEKALLQIQKDNPEKELKFNFFICKSSSIFSFHLFDNSLVFSTGLLLKIKTEQELGIILATEMSNALNKTFYKSYITSKLYKNQSKNLFCVKIKSIDRVLHGPSSLEKYTTEKSLNDLKSEEEDSLSLKLLRLTRGNCQIKQLNYRLNYKNAVFNKNEILDKFNSSEYKIDTTKFNTDKLQENLYHAVVFRNKYLLNDAIDFKFSNYHKNEQAHPEDCEISDYSNVLPESYFRTLNIETSAYKLAVGDYFSSLSFLLNTIKPESNAEKDYQPIIENMLQLLILKKSDVNFNYVLENTSANNNTDVAVIRALYNVLTYDELAGMTFYFVNDIYKKYPKNEYFLYAFGAATELKFSLEEAMDIYNLYLKNYRTGKYENRIQSNLEL